MTVASNSKFVISLANNNPTPICVITGQKIGLQNTRQLSGQLVSCLSEVYYSLQSCKALSEEMWCHYVFTQRDLFRIITGIKHYGLDSNELKVEDDFIKAFQNEVHCVWGDKMASKEHK